MFPKNNSNIPEIRFKGFTDDWEQRKAKEICSISSKKFFLPSKPEKEFKDNFEFTMCLFDMLLADAEEKNMSLIGG